MNGWCFGLGFFGYGVWWIQVSVHQFGVPYYWFSVPVTTLFVMFMASYPALASALTRWLPCSSETARLCLLAPLLWLLSEWLRGWFLTGFPWLTLGYSQTDGPLAAYAPLIGVNGCSLVIAFLAAALLYLVLARGWRSRAVVVACVLLAVLGAKPLEALRFTSPSGPAVRVTMVQGAVAQAIKWDFDQRQPSIELYESLSEDAWGGDLLLWPETAIPAFPHEVPELINRLHERSLATQTEMLVGVPTVDPDTREYYNSVLNFGPSPGRYDKVHLVPFGEFFPFQSLMKQLSLLLSIPMSDFTAGERDQRKIEINGHLAGISICYEDAYPSETLASLPAAAVLVNVSNDAWFGDSIAPHQHLQIARMRALEGGRYLLRATNTGISAIINDRGAVVARSPQFVPHALEGEYLPLSGATPFVRHRGWPILGFEALLLVVLIGYARSFPPGDPPKY